MLNISPELRNFWGGDVPIEQPLIEWARQLVLPDRLALDIGAHVGDWTVDLARHAREVHAFEPQVNTHELLVSNARQFPNVIVHRVALADKFEADAELRIINDHGGGSSIQDLPSTQNPLSTQATIVRTLDSFELNDIGFIKIDVEGSELAVLCGGIETLRRSGWPKIIFEAWSYPWFADQRAKLFQYIEAIGYRIVPITWWDMFLAERPA